MNPLISKIWHKHESIELSLMTGLPEAETLLLIDELACQYIKRFVDNDCSRLNYAEQQHLQNHYDELKRLLPTLKSNDLIYFKRLYELIKLVLNDAHSTFAARLHVLVARNGSNAIVLRRGPSKMVCSFQWHRKKNTFEMGQWFKGCIFERRSDISANGDYWIYFAANNKWSNKVKGSWTAVAKTPWLKALTLYAKGDAWHGGGLFSYDNKYWLNDGRGHKKIYGSALVKRNTEYEPKYQYGGECPHVYYNRLQRDGWKLVSEKKSAERGYVWYFEKNIDEMWVLRKICHQQSGSPVGKGSYWDEHELENNKGDILTKIDWEWCDWVDGAIVYAEFGQLLKIKIKNSTQLNKAELLHDFNDYQFEEAVAPY